MKLRPYQIAAKNNILAKLPTETCLLGFCTGGGKTFTTHALMKEWLELNPGKRILILAHNQTILRENFQAGSEWFEFTAGGDIERARAERVVVTIPSTIHRKDIGEFGLLVVDEAHEFWDRPMAKKISAKIGTHQTLLLTASHGNFKNVHKELLSVMEGIDLGILAETSIEIVSTAWNFSDKDYNKDEDLVSNYNHTAEEVDGACSALLNRIARVHKDTGFMDRMLKALEVFRLSKAPVLEVLPKTLVACHNVSMADKVYEWFNARFPGKAVISYSESTKGEYSDVGSSAINQFKADDSTRILIVVRRGVLGFDCPELEYVVDMTASRNVDRTNQLLGRAIRKYRDLDKKFFKVVPDHMSDYTWYQMGAVVALMHPAINRKWAGNAKMIPILAKSPLPKDRSFKTRKAGDKQERKEEKLPQAVLDLSEYRLVFEGADQWRDDQWLRSEKVTTLGKIKEWMGANRKFSDEEIAKIAKQFNTRGEFQKGDLSAYITAWHRCILDEVCSHMITAAVSRKLTDDEISKIAKQYNTRKAFQNGDSSAYGTAYKRGILDEVCEHMNVCKRKLTDDEIYTIAKEYNTRKAFQNGDSSAYRIALKRGILDAVCSHMDAVLRAVTDEEIYTIAKQYSSRTEFARGDHGAYQAAHRRGIIKEVCEHMTAVLRNLNNDQLHTIAKKYNTRTAFHSGDGSAYESARKRGILNEVCKHMKPGIYAGRPIKCHQTGEIYPSRSEAAKQLGVHPNSIDHVLRGRNKQTKGYTFEYVDMEEK